MQVERDKHAGLNQHIHLHIHPFVFSVLFTFGKRPGSIIIVQPDMAFVCVCVCGNRTMVKKRAEVSALERAVGWTAEGDPE